MAAERHRKCDRSAPGAHNEQPQLYTCGMHPQVIQPKPGEKVIIPASVSDEDARKKYPQGFKTLKPYLRIVDIA